MKLKTLCVITHSVQGLVVRLLCWMREIRETSLSSHHHRQFCRGVLTLERCISCVACKLLLTMLFFSGLLALVKSRQLTVLWKRLGGQGSQISKSIRLVVLKTKQIEKPWDWLPQLPVFPTQAHQNVQEADQAAISGQLEDFPKHQTRACSNSWMAYRTSSHFTLNWFPVQASLQPCKYVCAQRCQNKTLSFVQQQGKTPKVFSS